MRQHWRSLSLASDAIPMARVSNSAHGMDSTHDVEAADSFFHNHIIQDFAWNDVSVQVKHRKQGTKVILQGSSGQVSAGQILALMGPSGSGKSTLLNVLANRSRLPHTGTLSINGLVTPISQVQDYSSYVEQNDTHIGGLTVGETLDFAAKLATPTTSAAIRHSRTDDILSSLGLVEQRNIKVSPVLQAGISGGQKRRLGLGTALVTGPKILFLDEPTSGLDSAASYQVISFLSKIAKQHKLIVIASIHQPSSSTFDLFDIVHLISKGQTCYHGRRDKVFPYLSNTLPELHFRDSADDLLDLINTDFDHSAERKEIVSRIHKSWEKHANADKSLVTEKVTELYEEKKSQHWNLLHQARICWILLHRNFIKSYRDPYVYGTRMSINIFLSFVIGMVWLRLPYEQESIQTFINCIFFSSAFTALMVVAYAPPIIEDIRMLQKEHASGLYGAFAFTIANVLIGIPWLFLMSLVCSCTMYWATGLRQSVDSWVMFTIWLYADLLAAESMMVLISALAPQFVTALAIVSFANGLWLAVDGFLVPITQLNVFWKYVFHYANFQTYVFQGMMVNQFRDTLYDCQRLPDGTFHCMFLSDLANTGKVRGTAVLDAYGYPQDSTKIVRWLLYTIAIIVVHRLVGMLALHWRAKRK